MLVLSLDSLGIEQSLILTANLHCIINCLMGYMNSNSGFGCLKLSPLMLLIVNQIQETNNSLGRYEDNFIKKTIVTVCSKQNMIKTIFQSFLKSKSVLCKIQKTKELGFRAISWLYQLKDSHTWKEHSEVDSSNSCSSEITDCCLWTLELFVNS